MKNEMSIHLSRVNASESKQRKSVKSVVLWIVQTVLALLFLFAGVMKLVAPIEVLLAQLAVPLPGLFVRFIGVCEVTGAVGLIFPALLRVNPLLTPLAACGRALGSVGDPPISVIGMRVD